LDRITMLDWLREKSQTPAAIERFWRQVLVSAVNEDLDRMAASHGFQVLSLGFLGGAQASRMGVPKVPLASLYSLDLWRSLPQVEIRLGETVSAIHFDAGRVSAVETAGGVFRADHYISALPFDRLALLAPGLGIDYPAFEHVPITGIHLWFDRPVTGLPHATLLDRTIQWAFNKRDGRYIQVVVSASRSLTPMGRQEIVDLARAELAEFLPQVRGATLEKAHVVKELRATFSARPGLESARPPQESVCPNLSLAGDWTRTGWPATMEGAVRGGYLAAEAAARSLGTPRSFLLPDLA
jgi:zeta-carotene desaturase